MFAVWTEWANIAGRLVHEAMPYHFVFAFESLTAFASGAALNGAIVRTRLRVDVCMGTGRCMLAMRTGLRKAKYAL